MQFPEEAEVTTSDKKGAFMSVDGVEMQSWQVNDKKHSSVTLVLGKYDKEKTEDEEFIDNVNKELKDGDKIDKKEAIVAKKDFDKEFIEEKKKVEENLKKHLENLYKLQKDRFKKEYDKMTVDVMKELFEDERPLNTKTIGDLKYYVYRNGWQGQIDNETLNNREQLITFLNNHLDKIVRRRLSSNKINKFFSTELELPGDNFNMTIEWPVICNDKFRSLFDNLFF